MKVYTHMSMKMINKMSNCEEIIIITTSTGVSADGTGVRRVHSSINTIITMPHVYSW